jgi:hypothetical protein
VLAQGRYTDRPTLIYAPLTGNDFLKKLMTPIPPSAVLFVLQSGYAADLVMPIALDSVNGINNESRRGMKRPADPRFFRLVQLLRDLQLSGTVQVRIERPKDDTEASLIVFGPSTDPEIAAKGREVRDILGLKPDLQELKVFYGGYSGKDDEIAMLTRSMLQIMLELAAIVHVPASDVAEGRAAAGSISEQAQEFNGLLSWRSSAGRRPRARPTSRYPTRAGGSGSPIPTSVPSTPSLSSCCCSRFRTRAFGAVRRWSPCPRASELPALRIMGEYIKAWSGSLCSTRASSGVGGVGYGN